jgi:hypothetical protein
VELDHLFFLASPDAPELRRLDALGLTPTYRRTHVGQGTANVCYCFDNSFLEVLWVTSQEEARTAAVARMQLAERSDWRTTGVNPFGLAWRPSGGENTHVSTWQCTPPYLPAGVAIDVATDSDDLTQPLMFTFPGSRAPLQWPAERRGTLQTPAGFVVMHLASVWLPAGVQPSTTLTQIADAVGATIGVSGTGSYGMDIRLGGSAGVAGATLRLPTCEVLV